MSEALNVKSTVKEYYGQTLQSSNDLKTDACCTAEMIPEYAKPILAKVHDEVLMKYYGCGIVLPENLGGCSVLDLGSGSGRDVYVLSALVGESGKVVGIDMTDEQLEVAIRHRDYMANQFGYASSNVEFIKGDIDHLGDLNLTVSSFDCIVSNCVINLAQNKASVLKQAYTLLKEGGEFYFSDVYADRRIPHALQQDPVLYGECLSGALYWNDFLKIAREAGFKDIRQVTSRPLSIDNVDVQKKVGPIKFYSTTYRLFKATDMEEDCEDYGQAVRYKGTIPLLPNQFQLDEGHCFEAGRIYTVCGNTYMMLKNGRFKDHFDFYGDFSTHFGLYQDCGAGVEVVEEGKGVNANGGACC